MSTRTTGDINLSDISKYFPSEENNKKIKISVNPVTMVVTLKSSGVQEQREELESEAASIKPKEKKKKKKKKSVSDIDDYGLRKVFRTYKSDINAGITASELMEVLDEMGYKISKKECVQLKRYADSDGDGILSLQEFINLILYVFLKIEDTEDDILDDFKLFDHGETGFIPSIEIRRVLSNLGDKLSDDEMNSFIQKGDLDRDGTINCGEFTCKMMGKAEEYDKLHKLKM